MKLAVMVIILLSLFAAQQTTFASLEIPTKSGPAVYNVEIAANPLKQIRGLMYRPSITEGHGMLFLYTKDRIAYFWMKNVSFSLDIIFIDRCARIDKIHPSAKPGDPTIISSGKPVRAVLEIPGGASKRAQMRPGARVKLNAESAMFDNC